MTPATLTAAAIVLLVAALSFGVGSLMTAWYYRDNAAASYAVEQAMRALYLNAEFDAIIAEAELADGMSGVSVWDGRKMHRVTWEGGGINANGGCA